MAARVNATNRGVLALLGLLLLVAGVAGLLLSFGALGSSRATSRVLPGAVDDFVTTTAWLPWVAAAVCVLIALLALRWLLGQFQTSRLSHLDLTNDDRDGLTSLSGAALVHAAVDEVRGFRGVSDAGGHLREVPHRRLDLQVDLTDYADVGEVRQSIEHTTAANVRNVVGEPDLPIRVELRPTTRDRRAVG